LVLLLHHPAALLVVWMLLLKLQAQVCLQEQLLPNLSALAALSGNRLGLRGSDGWQCLM
jgi:hypothetical protein